MIIRAGLIPTDERAKTLWHNMPALMFTDMWQDAVRKEDLRSLCRELGIIWTREDVEAASGSGEGNGTAGRAKELRLPLTYVMEPGVIDIVKNYFGSKLGIDPPKWAMNTQVEDMYETDPKDFLNFVRNFVSPKIS